MYLKLWLLNTYYNNNNLPSTINFLGTIKDSDGNQSFPLSNLTSGEYFAFSNTYPTFITSGSTTYRITVISSGANAGKLRIEASSVIVPLSERIQNADCCSLT